MVTFRKLKDGSWGLHGERGDALVPGAQVDVRRADGAVRRMTVGAVLASYSDGGTVATIGEPPRGSRKGGNGKASKAPTETTAKPKGKGYICFECGERAYPAVGYCPVSGEGH